MRFQDLSARVAHKKPDATALRIQRIGAAVKPEKTSWKLVLHRNADVPAGLDFQQPSGPEPIAV
jgi:hypothetical protein